MVILLGPNLSSLLNSFKKSPSFLSQSQQRKEKMLARRAGAAAATPLKKISEQLLNFSRFDFPFPFSFDSLPKQLMHLMNLLDLLM